MKSFALGALIATVAAQQTDYNCVNPEGDDAWLTAYIADVYSISDCGTTGTAAITDTADYNAFDWCLHAAFQSEVAAVAATPSSRAVEAVPASITCAWF